MKTVNQCPECFVSLKLGARNCQKCGWEAPRARGEARPDADPNRGRCEWVSRSGVRCRFHGPMSNDTHGGGPWYCAWHFSCGGAEHGDEIVEQSTAWDGRGESFEKMRRDYTYGTRKATVTK